MSSRWPHPPWPHRAQARRRPRATSTTIRPITTIQTIGTRKKNGKNTGCHMPGWKAGAAAALGDHRLAMTFAIAGLVSGVEVRVDEPGAAAVSYPNFYDDLARVGAAA